MQYTDFSPSANPTLEQQRDALRKGLGRAMHWAIAGRLDDEVLLAACLSDLRHDTQIEESRGDWLWQMIRAVDAVDRFRVPILHALYDLADERSANQLCELASHFARAGDDTFRMRLYEIVEKKPIADCPWLAEEEIVKLDGEEGFLRAARARGKRLTSRGWDWDDSSLIHDATERYGEERVVELLGQAQEEGLRRFLDGWRAQEKAKVAAGAGPSHREKCRSYAVADIINAAGSSEAPFGLFRSWGIYADEDDLKSVLSHLLVTEDSRVVSNLLAAFSSRACPHFDDRLIALCRHCEPEVCRRAFIALKQMSHPALRDFAIGEIESRKGHWATVGLIIKNYRAGDEHRILDAVELPEDEDELHWLLMDVIMLLEANPDADPSRLAVVTYASTPCGSCREDSALLLHNRQAAPSWLTEECQLDSCQRTRRSVEAATGS